MYNVEKCSVQDFQQFQFTAITRLEDLSLCPCKKDPNHTGVTEIPHILKCYWEELKRLNPLEKAKQLFRDFCKRSALIMMFFTTTKEIG